MVDEYTLMEVTTLAHPTGLIFKEDGRDDENSDPGSTQNIMAPTQSTSLPVLSSLCPGFVCLVEKTAPLAAPLLSSAKSPMAVAGVLLKTGPRDDGDANEQNLDSSSGSYAGYIICYAAKDLFG